MRVYKNDMSGYYVCPRCHVPMEFDFQNYCSHCGQALDWKRYYKAKVVKAGK